MSIEATDRKQFSQQLIDLRNKFGDKLVDYEFQFIMQEHKEAYLPPKYLLSRVKK